MSFLEGLNSEQRAAVLEEHPALLVTAGPGTGKTRVLTARLARLLEGGAAPERILAVTFTRSAAQELRRRLLASGLSVSPWTQTFHSLALRLLAEEGRPFGAGVPFSLIREEDKAAVLDGVVGKREASRVLAEARRRKQALLDPEGSGAEYQARLRERRLLDFDDLLLEAVRLLDSSPEALARWQGRFQHALIDEFQDTGRAQYELLRRLRPERLCVVGDPDQAIYGFDGGSFEPFSAFRVDHPGHRVIALSENYRSQAAILDAASRAIAANPAALPRSLEARLERGLPVEIAAHASEAQEAEMIAKRVEGLLGGSSRFTVDTGWVETESDTGRYGLGDIAVLYRLHSQAQRIRAALERQGLPCRVYGRPEPEAGPAKDHEALTLDADAAPSHPSGDAVSLMTLHRSKGLEFPVVFIAGCEEGVLPFLRGDGADRLAEERRLFYVGMTRAQSRLCLSWSRSRSLFGRRCCAGVSRFVADIEAELKRIEDRRIRPLQPKAAQPELF